MTNPNRPTPTWKLVTIGVLLGLAFAVWTFTQTPAEDAAQTGHAAAQWGPRVLLLAVIVAGGWGALRRTRNK